MFSFYNCSAGKTSKDHVLYCIDKLYRHRPPNRKRKIEKDKGRRLGGLASLGPLGARLFERKLDKDKGRRLGGLASLGPLGAR